MNTELLERVRRSVDPLDADHPVGPAQHRQAAVLLILDPADPGLPILFVQRADHLRHHAGQIGLPGGTTESHDDDLAATAVREAAEEVGVEPGNVDVIGKLPPFLTAGSLRWLTAIVAVQRQPWTPSGDGWEVAQWFRVRLVDVLAAPHRVEEVQSDAIRRRVHFYEVDGRIIWGATAAILHELMRRLGRED